MEVHQLKHDLLDKLVSIDDKDLLEQINELINGADLEKSNFKVSERQLQLLEKSESDIENGRLISDEELNKEEDRWLNG